MIELRPFARLGAADHGWLDALHHFSFADYHDPMRTKWGQLRVSNDDTLAPKFGFPPHPHRHMEIITYVAKARSRIRTTSATLAEPKQVTSRLSRPALD